MTLLRGYWMYNFALSLSSRQCVVTSIDLNCSWYHAYILDNVAKGWYIHLVQVQQWRSLQCHTTAAQPWKCYGTWRQWEYSINLVLGRIPIIWPSFLCSDKYNVGEHVRQIYRTKMFLLFCNHGWDHGTSNIQDHVFDMNKRVEWFVWALFHRTGKSSERPGNDPPMSDSAR